MAEELPDVQPSEVKFLETIKRGNGTVVFKTRIRGNDYVLKVVSRIAGLLLWWLIESQFHGCPGYSFIRELEPSLFLREKNAYKLLTEKNFCARGVVPTFHGTIENIYLSLWPDLQTI